MSVAGARIAVVGAGGDIGGAIVTALQDASARVVGLQRSSCDVTDLGSVRSGLGGAHAALGGIDGLVVAHGAPGCIKPTLELSDEDFCRVLEIDLVGTLRVCREARRYGPLSIVILSSIHALATYPQRAAYAAAKAGVVGLARALAIEWAKDGSRVNCVLPGQVADSRRTQGLMGSSTRLRERSPSGGLPSAQDVAAACVYLLSAQGVNGTTLVVDDGWLSSAYFDKHG